MACKNVVPVEFTPSEKVSKKWEKKVGSKLHGYKVLRVVQKPVSAQSIGEEKSSRQSLMPLHIARGHIKRYTEAAPLFGKYVGNVYCPSHVRGFVENGTRDKNYKLG